MVENCTWWFYGLNVESISSDEMSLFAISVIITVISVIMTVIHIVFVGHKWLTDSTGHDWTAWLYRLPNCCSDLVLSEMVSVQTDFIWEVPVDWFENLKALKV